MLNTEFLGAMLDKRRDKVSQEDDGGLIRLRFTLIPNPEGSRATSEWVDLINSEWGRNNQGSTRVELAHIQVSVDYDYAFFELPAFALDRLENAITTLERIMELKNQIYAAQMKRNKKAEANRDSKLNEILDRISKK